MLGSHDHFSRRFSCA
jgi:hypothetical protein